MPTDTLGQIDGGRLLEWPRVHSMSPLNEPSLTGADAKYVLPRLKIKLYGSDRYYWIGWTVSGGHPLKIHYSQLKRD